MVDQSIQASGSDRAEYVEIKRGALQKGDRFTEIGANNAVLQRMRGEWWCVCKEKHWDCDIGPNGDVWCTEKCVRYECTPIEHANLSALLVRDE